MEQKDSGLRRKKKKKKKKGSYIPILKKIQNKIKESLNPGRRFLDFIHHLGSRSVFLFYIVISQTLCS